MCDASMCTTSHWNAIKMSSLFGKHFPCSGVFNFGMRSKSYGLRSGEYGGCYKISHPHHCKSFSTQAAVWHVALSWRIIALFRSAGRECTKQTVLQEWSVVCSIDKAALKQDDTWLSYVKMIMTFMGDGIKSKLVSSWWTTTIPLIW